MFSRKSSRASLPPVPEGVIQSIVGRIEGVREQAGKARITVVFAPSEFPPAVLGEAAKQSIPEAEIHGVIFEDH